jgi:hypothetical protein
MHATDGEAITQPAVDARLFRGRRSKEEMALGI